MKNGSHLIRENRVSKIIKCILVCDELNTQECILLWDGGSITKKNKKSKMMVVGIKENKISVLPFKLGLIGDDTYSSVLLK